MDAEREPTSEGQARPRLILAALSALSGCLLFLSDHPVHAWPLQLVAFVPWLAALARLRPSWLAAVGSGFMLGAAYAVPLLFFLGFPVALGAALGAYLILLWMVLGVLMARVLAWSPLSAALGAGAAAVLVEWVEITLVPIWGTAQCFARVWSAAPWAVQFVSLTGILGVVFVVVTLQAILVGLGLHPGRRRALLTLAAAIVLTVGAVDLWLWSAVPTRHIGVAALGWTLEQLPEGPKTSAQRVLDEMVAPALDRAQQQGASLLVTPEVGLRLRDADAEPVQAWLGAAAREHGLWLAIGVFHHPSDTNRVLVFDSEGRFRGKVIKTHLIAFLERYTPGVGETPAWPFAGTRLGAMICQDDNFTDLSRANGRNGVRVMAVPTNDWREVRAYHLENALFRPMESRYGLIRAASGGISAIVDARGQVLARRDHFAAGPGLITAQLPIYDLPTTYADTGDWPVLLLALGVLVLGRRRG